jgi:hypothetical protein
MKTNLGQICHRQGCGLQVPSGLEPEGLCLDHYLEIAFQRLRNVSERVHQEQDTDRGTIDWLLAQVDFAVGSLAEQSEMQDTNQRTRLLELLLGVANLNEHMRHTAVPVRRPA